MSLLPPDIKGSHKSIKDLSAIVESQVTQLAELSAMYKQLVDRVAELEKQIGQNSRNSSKLPSSDWKKIKPAFPRKTGKVGGKPNHKPDTLKMVAKADRYEEHEQKNCLCCSKEQSLEPLLIHARLQVFDIPKPKMEVTEQQVLSWVCSGCAHEKIGQFPEGVNSQTQYETRIKTMSVLLNNAYFMPRGKIKLLFKAFFSLSINESTFQSQQNFAYSALEEDKKHTKGKLIESPLVHFDETGIYIGGVSHWWQGASNEKYTYTFAHPKRGKLALRDEKSILPDFTNRAIHDCWSSYFSFTKCLHSLCNSHILRELTGLIESDSKWAVEMQSFLFEHYEKPDHGKGTIDENEKQDVLQKFAAISEFANIEEPPPIAKPRGKPKKTKGRNLYDRLLKHQDALLAFTFYEEGTFTNNQAERDIRPATCKLKASGAFRTKHGANVFARVHTFCSTVRKQGNNLFNELFTILEGGVAQYRIEIT